MLKKKYIRFNTLFYITFILIIKKFNKDLRIYVNYKTLNVITIRNRNILFLIKKLYFDYI